MKKRVAVLLAAVMMASLLFTVPALAANDSISYYDEYGNQIEVNGMYYNTQGYPMYNASCYYIDADGNPAYVGGCRAYYYDENGNLVAGDYYYNANGQAVSRPMSYPGGYGCGMFYYNSQGNTMTGTFYYDDFGNRVDPPANSTPGYRGRGHCGRW